MYNYKIKINCLKDESISYKSLSEKSIKFKLQEN